MVKIIFCLLKLSQYGAFAAKLHSVGAEQGSCGQIPLAYAELSLFDFAWEPKYAISCKMLALFTKGN